jgi:N-acetylmuramoyl-L-alanine amidase
MIDLPAKEIQCVAIAIYEEARGESELGKKAIAHVIYNRAKHRELTPCQVIRQPGQFSFKIKKSYKGRTWDSVYRIAQNPGIDPTAGAYFFHNKRVKPGWHLKKTAIIGGHLFFQ